MQTSMLVYLIVGSKYTVIMSHAASGESWWVYQQDIQMDGRRDAMESVTTRWLYCLECPQCSIWLETLGYLCTSCLLPAFDEA